MDDFEKILEHYMRAVMAVDPVASVPIGIYGLDPESVEYLRQLYRRLQLEDGC